MLSILVAFFLSSAQANTPGVACEVFTMPVAGCGPHRKENAANCVVIQNHTPYYAEVGIKGLCPVGSGTSVARPPNGLPAYIDGNPADPTVGARNVVTPNTEAYMFIRPDPTSPTWALPSRLQVEARLLSQVTAGVVTNAQFVPGYTHVANPIQGGPVSAGYFCQPIDTRPPYNYATVRRENFCD